MRRLPRIPHAARFANLKRLRKLAHRGDGRSRRLQPAQCPPDRSSPALPDESGPKPNGSEVTNDMAAATDKRQPRDVVEFPPNAPISVALKYSQGRTISGQYGERVMFTLTDGRVMFLSPEVAGRIESLGINVR